MHTPLRLSLLALIGFVLAFGAGVTPLAPALAAAPQGQAPAQAAPPAAAEYTLKDGTYTHKLYGFTITRPSDKWTVTGGPEAARRAGAQGVEVFFSRAGNSARAHIEVQYNATISPRKFLEQLDEVYGRGAQKLGSESLRLRSGAAAASRHRITTPNGTSAILFVVAAGTKEYKLGFLFAAPEADYPKFRVEYLKCLNSLKFVKPKVAPKKTPHALAGLRLTVATPNAYWGFGLGSYWPNGPADAIASLTRKPYAAYGLVGARPAESKNLEQLALEVARAIAKLNQNNEQVRRQGRASTVKVAGTRGLKLTYQNRSAFPFTTYQVTVFNHGGRAVWLCLWSLPDNVRAMQSDFDAIAGSFAAPAKKPDGNDDKRGK